MHGDIEAVLCLDPGTIQTGWMILDIKKERPVAHGIDDNEYMDNVLIPELTHQVQHLAIEHITNYGQIVGQETFDTAMWVGRFVKTANLPYTLCFRPYILLHLCHSMHAKEPRVKSVLYDRYGQKGTKKNPGILYGVKDHIWSALCIGTYFSDQLDMGLVTDPIDGTWPPFCPIENARKNGMKTAGEIRRSKAN